MAAGITGCVAFVLALVAAVPALADPPYWAHRGPPPAPPPPAPYVSQGACNRTAIGAALGAAAGGVVGSQMGTPDNQAATTIGGVLVGAFVGGVIGHSMDKSDQACAGQALEYAPDNRTVVWQGQQQSGYWVTPTRSYPAANQSYCRDYTSNAVINGRGHRNFGTACRSDDGSWRVTKR